MQAIQVVKEQGHRQFYSAGMHAMAMTLTATQTQTYADTQTHRHADTQTHRHTDTQKHTQRQNTQHCWKPWSFMKRAAQTRHQLTNKFARMGACQIAGKKGLRVLEQELPTPYVRKEDPRPKKQFHRLKTERVGGSRVSPRQANKMPAATFLTMLFPSSVNSCANKEEHISLRKQRPNHCLRPSKVSSEAH